MSDLSDVTDSARRCMARQIFYDTFFGRLGAAVPEAAELFKDADEVVLKNFLRNAITLILSDAAGSRHAADKLAQVRERHGPSDLNLNPEWFPPWIEAVIVAARTADPQINHALETAWRKVITPGVQKVIP